MADEAPVGVIRMDADAFRAAPKVFAQTVVVTLGEDDVHLIFGVKAPGTIEKGGSPDVEALLPQAVCYLSIPQFFKLVDLMNRQAEKWRELMGRDGT